MKVIAKHQVAHNNRLYKGGEVFEVTNDEFELLMNDVEIVDETKSIESQTTKQVGKEKNKMVERMSNKSVKK